MTKRSTKRRGPARTTPKEIRHRKRSREQQRTLFLAVGLVIAAIVIILGFGYYRENFAAARSPVAVVNGQSISTRDYQQMVNYQRFNLLSRFGGQVDQQVLADFLQNQVPSTVLDNMINQVLVEQYAAEAGITVADSEVQQTIERQFGFTGDVAAPTSPASDAVTTTNSASPMTRSDFEAAFANFLETLKTQTGLSESKYRNVLRGELLQDKVRKQITADVPATASQVHARHILVETEEEAQKVYQRLVGGEDFAAVAEEVSTDTASAKDGGDLGWFGRGKMVAEFEDVAFSAPVGEINEPVKSQFGYHIIQVLERDENHALSPDQLDQAQQQRYSQWLDEQQSGSDIQRYWTPEIVPTIPGASTHTQPIPPPPAPSTPSQ